MAAHDPATRRLVASLGGLNAAIKSDPRERGRASVRARRQKLYDATDAALPESERLRLTELAFRVEMQRKRLGKKGGAS